MHTHYIRRLNFLSIPLSSNPLFSLSLLLLVCEYIYRLLFYLLYYTFIYFVFELNLFVSKLTQTHTCNVRELNQIHTRTHTAIQSVHGHTIPNSSSPFVPSKKCIIWPVRRARVRGNELPTQYNTHTHTQNAKRTEEENILV